MSTAPTASVRDVIPNRSFVTGGAGIGSTSVVVLPDPGAATSTFFPTPGAVHTVAVLAAPSTWTLTDAVSALPYDLKIGEGFIFYMQNNGASTLTFACAGNITQGGAGTITVPTSRTRIFSLTRTGAVTYQLHTLGVLVQ